MVGIARGRNCTHTAYSRTGEGHPAGFYLEDSGTQRNLFNEDREQAKRIGERFRSENVTVDVVLHSVWCRTRNTAELAFPGHGKLEPAINSFFHIPETEPKQTKQTKEIISSWRGHGALVLVPHQVNITALTGIFPKEGEAIILQPLVDEYELLEKLVFDLIKYYVHEWPLLAESRYNCSLIKQKENNTP